MELLPWLPLLQESPQFAGMSGLEIMRILDTGTMHSGFSGEALTRTGDLADCCYLILEGQVEVRVRFRTSAHSVAILEAGQMLGEVGLFQPQSKRMADSFVRQRAMLVRIPYSGLKNLAFEEPLLFEQFRRNLQNLATSRVSSLREPGEPAATAAIPPSVDDGASEPIGDPSPPPISVPLTPLEFAPISLAPIQIKMALSRCALFEGLDEAVLGLLMEIAEPLRLEAKEYLIRYGEVADCLYVVALGRLSVLARVGKVTGPVAELRPGQCVGEFPLAFKQSRRMCSVATMTTTTLIRFTYQDLQRLESSRPDIYKHILEKIKLLADQRA